MKVLHVNEVVRRLRESLCLNDALFKATCHHSRLHDPEAFWLHEVSQQHTPILEHVLYSP